MSIIKTLKKKAAEVRDNAAEWIVQNEDVFMYGLGIVVGASAGAVIMGVHKDLKFADILDQISQNYVSKTGITVYSVHNPKTMEAGIEIAGKNIFGDNISAFVMPEANQLADFANSLTENAIKAGATNVALPEIVKPQSDVSKELEGIAAQLIEIQKSV